MTTTASPRWLEWAREIQALGQTGLTYSLSQYDTERYQRLVQIAAEIIHAHTGLPVEPVLQELMAQPGYATPKVDVRGAVVREDKILLVQERIDGLWCMPGGWADVGDRPSEMVVREVREESGFDVVPRKLVGVYDANRSGTPQSLYHAYKLVFLCELTAGEAQPSYETLAVGFFDFDDLPLLSWERTNERHLADVRAHLLDESLPAVFD